jgi:hypothetical protein
MAPKNLEEAIVDRIQRALAKELRRLRGESRSTGNGQAASQVTREPGGGDGKDSAVKGDGWR